MQKAKPKASRGFTLLELIIVIAILAILSVAVVLVINPAETLARARDSQRLSDLAAIKSSIGLYLAEVSSPDLDNQALTDECLTDVWISLTAATVTADATGLCGVAFAAGTYIQSDSGFVNGTGWIPVALTDITGLGAPISNFPLDPVNALGGGVTTDVDEATDNVYIYMCDNTNSTFEINTIMESGRYSAPLGDGDKESTDGGDNDLAYEVGTTLSLCTNW